MKNTLLYAFTLLFSFAASAQSSGVFIHLESDPNVAYNGQTVTISGTEQLVYTNLYIQNVSGATKQYKWERVKLDLSSPAFTDQLCDNEICFDCNGDPWIRPFFYELNDTDSTLFQPKMFFNGGGGYARFRYYVLDENEDRIDWVTVEFTSTLSAGEEALENIEVYPNPSSGMVTVKNASEGASFEVLDMLGKVAYKAPMSAASQKVNLSGLPDGVYFYVVKDKRGNALPARKLIIRKQ